MSEKLYIGSYSSEQNAYDISEIEALCKSNQGIYRMGFKGYTPLCCGHSCEAVTEELDELRESKKYYFRQFESAMVDLVTSYVGEGADVHIEFGEDTGVGDSFTEDGIAIIPEEHKGGPFPVIGLFSFYRAYFLNRGKHDDPISALKGTAEDILSVAMDMWENPVQCPYCAEEK